MSVGTIKKGVLEQSGSVYPPLSLSLASCVIVNKPWIFPVPMPTSINVGNFWRVRMKETLCECPQQAQGTCGGCLDAADVARWETHSVERNVTVSQCHRLMMLRPFL